MGDKPQPWWFHLVVALAVVAICFAVYGLSKLANWALGETWGPVAFIVVMVLTWTTWAWSADRRRKARR